MVAPSKGVYPGSTLEPRDTMVSDRRLLWVISYHHACNDGTLMALIALLPILKNVMGLSYYEIGVLGFGLIITVIVQYLVGRYADRAFSKYLLETGAVLMGLSFVLLLAVNDFVGLFIVVIGMRIGAAFYHPVGTSWITRTFAGPHLETALGVQSGVGNLGVIVAMASSGFLGEMYSWKAPCVLWALMNLAAVLLGLTMVKETSAPMITLQVAPRSSRETLRKMLIFVPAIITGGALYQITSTFGPLNLTSTEIWKPGDADLIFAIWIGVGTITSYYFGAISSRFGRFRLLAAGYFASAISASALVFATQWWLIAPILIFYGTFLFVTYPALFSFVTDSTVEGERGTAFGILFGFQLGGGALMVYLCGIIADVFGTPKYVFIVAAVLSIVSLSTLFWGRTIRAPLRSGL
jgi:MFS family permease